METIMVAFAQAGDPVGLGDVQNSPTYVRAIGENEPPDSTGLAGLIVFGNRRQAIIPFTQKVQNFTTSEISDTYV